MSMVLGDLLAMIRQDYLDSWVATHAEAEGNAVTEVKMGEGAVRLGAKLWADLSVNGRLEDVTSEGVFKFDEAITFGWGDALPGQPEPLEVRVLPFAWDDCLVLFEAPTGKTLNPAPLVQWLAQWADEGMADAAHAPFKGLVHGAMDAGKGAWRIDFGSAPLDAWQDVLEAALAMGASRATFGHAQG